MKLPSVQESMIIKTFEYPSYFVEYICNLEIDVRPYTDDNYHDAPINLTISMNVDDLVALRSQIDTAIEVVQMISEKYKDREIK